MSQAAGQVNILIFLLKIKFSPCMPINFVMQGKCLFSDISRPVWVIINSTNLHIYLCLFVCFCLLVSLRPMSTAMVIAGRSVHLTTLFPGQA